MKLKLHIDHRLNFLLVCAISIACLLLALPRDSKFGYEYEVGKPWNYAPLIADFGISHLQIGRTAGRRARQRPALPTSLL